MILSIVTGTYNRLDYLQRMVNSARACIPRGMDYEFVVVDGGSTDRTQEYCHEQDDIRLIEHGALHGAIAAFCDGATAAQGEYVLLANDDIEFVAGSIVPAIVHLEQRPTCGAVAFADDRPVQGYPDGFKVQTMQVNHNGIKALPYAQVGLFRRWLGDAAGWWGADDAQFKGHTYGGDNYLSARIYEMGFTVDTVPACKVVDRLPADDLRERNYKIEGQQDSAYYQRYATPPVFGRALYRNAEPDPERLRFLYLPLYERGYGHYKSGLRDALARAGLVWEVDYLSEQYDLVDIVRQFQPHILLMQMHSPNDLDLPTLNEARRANPGMLVINWNGDVYEQHLTSEPMLAFLKHVDLQLVVNADVLPVYQEMGIPAAYWQVSYETVDYDHLPHVPTHDVVFLANAYTDARKALGEALRAIPGVNVGLYGFSWAFSDGVMVYDFARGAAIYRKAKIAIGDNQYHRRGFVSNRIFEALASGAFLLHETVPGLEELTGLKDGVHYVAWDDLQDLHSKVTYWLKNSQTMRREQIAGQGQQFVQAHHAFDARVKELLTEIVPALEGVKV